MINTGVEPAGNGDILSMITTVVGNYPKVPSLGNGPNMRTAISRFDQGRITAEAFGPAIAPRQASVETQCNHIYKTPDERPKDEDE